MKVVATIFQCKRVSLPYFFIKYCVPIMRTRSGFKIDTYLIQHLTPIHHVSLETSRLNGTENVKKFTEEGKFNGAHIIQHSINHAKCPPYPSYKIGVETALKENADLHIWLEDDALILDRNMRMWNEIKDVGTYSKWSCIPVRHTITTRSFDKRMLDLMNNEEWNAGAWGDGPQKGHPEYFMTKCCKEKKYLDEKYVAFHHDTGDPNGWNVPVDLKIIKSIVPPNELNILNLDYKNAI